MMLRKVGFTILIIGILTLAKGLWIPVKAEISQILLTRAWETVLRVKSYQKPWPWADVAAVGRLTVQKHGVEQIILSGMNGQSLAFGPGHNSQTALPGEPGLVMLGGHRDTHFKFLQDFSVGDRLMLEGRKGAVSYRVNEIFVIDTRSNTLHNQTDDMLLMVTCYPFDSAIPSTPYRYVVRAESIVTN